MSIFGKIMSAIFGHGAAAEGSQASAPAAAPAAGGSSAPSRSSPGRAGPASSVDVEAVLKALAAKKKKKLDWRRSIVDLMELLDLDNSLSARKELAKELHYSGNMNDSAAMNVWLHKQVMKKLAENGGKVPEDLQQ